MSSNCAICSTTFEISANDTAFLEKISPTLNGIKHKIPAPTLCPDCRMQRRLSFRNQATLYKRTCDKTGKEIISIYSEDKPYKVITPDEWWSDKWNPIDYGIDIDSEKSFFAQFDELMKKVPHIAVLKVNSTNSDYTNQTYNCRNCYVSSAIKDCEDCMYCHNANRLKDCVDCSFCFDSQLLHQCFDTYQSYNSIYLVNQKNPAMPGFSWCGFNS